MPSNKLAVSVIITVRNEEKTIGNLLLALAEQTYQPAEIVITDACSTDRTVQMILDFSKHHKQIPIQLESLPCNRSKGRNRAIERAKYQLIAITDAGCLPDKQWLAELVLHYDIDSKPVVAGYAVGYAVTSFQQAVVPYFLVMPDRVDPATYLPATRSMLIHKSRWEEANRFNESLNTSEDYVFAHSLRRKRVPIIFSSQAIVQWQPPSSLQTITKTFITFAAADVTGGVLRTKVLAVFARYLLASTCFLFFPQIIGWKITVLLAAVCVGSYFIWAVWKNKRYAPQGWFYLPLLQLLADCCVITGTMIGAWQFILLRGRRR